MVLVLSVLFSELLHWLDSLCKRDFPAMACYITESANIGSNGILRLGILLLALEA